MAADPRLRPRGHWDRHVSCFQCKAVLILVCGTSLCVLTRNQNNLAKGTEFLHWQLALFTNKPAVSTGPCKVRVSYKRLDTRPKTQPQFFHHHHPKIMRPHSAVQTAIPLAWPSFLTSFCFLKDGLLSNPQTAVAWHWKKVTLTRIDVFFYGGAGQFYIGQTGRKVNWLLLEKEQHSALRRFVCVLIFRNVRRTL